MTTSDLSLDRELTEEEKGLLVKAREEARMDPVKFCKLFLHIFDPRVKPSDLKFMPFPYQEDLIKDIRHSIEYGEDIFIDKSRDVGATYTTLAVFCWFWLFVQHLKLCFWLSSPLWLI